VGGWKWDDILPHAPLPSLQALGLKYFVRKLLKREHRLWKAWLKEMIILKYIDYNDVNWIWLWVEGPVGVELSDNGDEP
jgi:hypothetical protein